MTLTSTVYEFEDDAAGLADFFDRGYTDGLPVVIPTPARVEAMLAGAGLAPDAILGSVPTRNVEATAEKVAANAVMAGCRPGYFPVVVAAVRAFLQPKANAHSTTATLAGSPHVVIVNGPVRREIDIECGQACFGPGFQANATIGRALRLVIRNVCRTVPGVLDRASFSTPSRYSFCFGEDEERSDWVPLHVQLGYEREQSVVTVQSVLAQLSCTEFDPAPREILDTIARMARVQGLQRDEFAGDARSIVVVVGLEHQRRLVEGGWTKAAIAEHLYPLLTADTVDKANKQVLLASPDNILIVAAGGPGLAQSFVIAPHLSAPTHELVVTGRAAAGLSSAAAGVIAELDEIVAADGGRLLVRGVDGSTVTLALDLSASNCPECVLPKDMLVQIATARLRDADPDIASVELSDPREDPGFEPSGH